MAKTDRVRVDYMPCDAALAALQAAQVLYPKASTQALIDRMVITGLSALVHGKWQPPSLWGHRERWKLPDDLRDVVTALGPLRRARPAYTAWTAQARAYRVGGPKTPARLMPINL